MSKNNKISGVLLSIGVLVFIVGFSSVIINDKGIFSNSNNISKPDISGWHIVNNDGELKDGDKICFTYDSAILANYYNNRFNSSHIYKKNNNELVTDFGKGTIFTLEENALGGFCLNTEYGNLTANSSSANTCKYTNDVSLNSTFKFSLAGENNEFKVQTIGDKTSNTLKYYTGTCTFSLYSETGNAKFPRIYKWYGKEVASIEPYTTNLNYSIDLNNCEIVDIASLKIEENLKIIPIYEGVEGNYFVTSEYVNKNGLSAHEFVIRDNKLYSKFESQYLTFKNSVYDGYYHLDNSFECMGSSDEDNLYYVDDSNRMRCILEPADINNSELVSIYMGFCSKSINLDYEGTVFEHIYDTSKQDLIGYVNKVLVYKDSIYDEVI